uniref:Fructose-bisphosphate aldolase n=1 Tax=Diplonema papillatum TaxID=91374 RepID=E0D6T1_9EUGL|nr:fructose 1,6-bisphosphate aldolase [Diplonema papillatum]
MSARIEVLKSHLSPYAGLQTPFRDELIATARKLCTTGKGLLAADESQGSCDKRFKPIGLPNNEENRRRYRALMLGAEGLEQYISGVIFQEETLTQKYDDGRSFPELCNSLGIVPGIKTDKGLVDAVGGAPGEQATQGLDNYEKRAAEYYAQGARFCKWRNTYKIQNGTVSEYLIHHNAETLAKYAQLSQKQGLVPIVEPEVMIDGNHDIAACQAVSQRVWAEVVRALHAHGVIFEGMLLKPNMVVYGSDCGTVGEPVEVARATLTTLARTLPASVPGIFFLSGGLSESNASAYLSAMNACTDLPRPWAVRFSYARALQASALKAWGGKEENKAVARKVLLHRAKMNSLATLGKYNPGEDSKGAKESLYIKGNTY